MMRTRARFHDLFGELVEAADWWHPQFCIVKSRRAWERLSRADQVLALMSARMFSDELEQNNIRHERPAFTPRHNYPALQNWLKHRRFDDDAGELLRRVEKQEATANERPLKAVNEIASPQSPGHKGMVIDRRQTGSDEKGDSHDPFSAGNGRTDEPLSADAGDNVIPFRRPGQCDG
jgi:hypothetical protein